MRKKGRTKDERRQKKMDKMRDRDRRKEEE